MLKASTEGVYFSLRLFHCSLSFSLPVWTRFRKCNALNILSGMKKKELKKNLIILEVMIIISRLLSLWQATWRRKYVSDYLRIFCCSSAFSLSTRSHEKHAVSLPYLKHIHIHLNCSCKMWITSSIIKGELQVMGGINERAFVLCVS